MADYPSLPTAYGSDPEALNRLDIDRAEDGTARARALYTTDKRRWKIVHPLLTQAQKLSLDDHYAAHRTAVFDYACPVSGQTYAVLYARAPAYERIPGGWTTAKVEIEEA